MTLSNEERGHLEKSIDNEISSLSRTVGIARVARNNTEWQVKKFMTNSMMKRKK